MPYNAPKFSYNHNDQNVLPVSYYVTFVSFHITCSFNVKKKKDIQHVMPSTAHKFLYNHIDQNVMPFIA